MNPQTKRKSVVGEKSDCNPASVKHWGTKKARGISSSSCRPGHLSLLSKLNQHWKAVVGKFRNSLLTSTHRTLKIRKSAIIMGERKLLISHDEI